MKQFSVVIKGFVEHPNSKIENPQKKNYLRGVIWHNKFAALSKCTT